MADDDDPNEAYDVVPVKPVPFGPPEGWFEVLRNGVSVWTTPSEEAARRFATDPAYRAHCLTDATAEGRY